MSQYGTYYTMSWITAQEDVTVTATIYDTENIIDDSASPTVYELTPTGNPCTISVIDNNRKKYGIKAKQAKLEFYSVPGIQAYNFADSNDQRWLVEIKANSEEMIFTGFVVLSDISRQFLPDKSVITLTCSDGLGLLKEKPFLIGSANPTGKLYLGQIVHYCLLQTGLNLYKAVHNNVRAYFGGDFLDSTNHLYSTIGVDVKTFEKSIGESEDCYTILEKILDKDCFLFQYRNMWWIMRPDDFDANDAYIAYFNLSGTASSYSTVDITKNLGEGESHFFIDAAQVVEYERPYKFAKHTFKYEYPNEIPCNVNFERGGLNTTVSSTEKWFDLSCWEIKQGIGSTSTSPLVTPYIRRIYDGYNTEIERYAVIPMPPDASTALHYIESEAIPIDDKDRFTFNVDYKWSGDASSGSSYTQAIATIRLEGSDGSHWTLDDDGLWYLSNDTWSSNFKYLEETFTPSNVDETKYRTYSIDATDAPIDGDIYIMLYALNQQPSSSVDNYDIHFNNLTFDYKPLINSSYAQFTGQSSKVSRSNYSANVDEDVSLSDSPKQLMKGAMFYYDAGTWQLHNEYFNATPFANGDPPDTTYVHPFEYIRVFANYNQYRRGLRYFSGNIYWLGAYWPDLVHKWNMTDADNDSSPRKFMLLNFEQNWKTGRWSGTFAETYHSDGKDFSDTFTFKYEN